MQVYPSKNQNYLVSNATYSVHKYSAKIIEYFDRQI